MTGNKRAGFTLIELLVVVAVFSLIFLVGTAVFTNIQTFQRNVLTRQRIAADGRYILEAIARTVRLGSIDYAYYKSQAIDLANPTSILVVRDQLNVQTCYQKNGTVIRVGTDCTGWTDLTPSDLSVQEFWVRIQPRSNPYLPTPTSSADCAPTGTFIAADGVCQCGSVNNCFADQTCVLTSAGNRICKNATVQPQVTVNMLTRSANQAGGEFAQTRLQTTVTSRIYGQ